MKNIFLAAAISVAALSATTASAQFAYNFSNLSQTYTPLTGATSLTRQSLWTSDTSFTVPIGFNFKLAGTTLNSVHIAAGDFITAPQPAAVVSGLIMLGTSLMDRGALTGTAKSDIRYSTTGAAGSRIFKLEVYNAGFEDEFFNYNELKDSISMQLWFYEGSNITEFRYGPSRITHFTDYFILKMQAGYLRNIDTATATFDQFYLLNGTPAAPTLDSVQNFFSTKGLNAIPASGTVYRFTPKGNTTGLGQVTTGTLAKVYPTSCINELNIERSVSGTLNYAILSLNGQVMRQGAAGVGKTTSIDISTLATGTYLVRMTDADKAFEVQRIIKL